MSDRKKAYAKAGVDVDLGNRVKATLPSKLARTNRPEVLGKVGGFGGLFRAAFHHMEDPILVSSIDGVGTKVKVSALMNKHDTIGEDLVNHCVNDIAVIGAEPLFFLDYMASATLDPDRFTQLIKGLVRGCEKAGCALIGGETAQMPGVYQSGDYDLVGTVVGVVDRKDLIDGKLIRPGDQIIGLPSSGLHTNGYSLARDILFNHLGYRIDTRVNGLRGTIGQELLRVHVSYLNVLRELKKKVTLKGIAHITGGGLVDNIPRVLPDTVDAEINIDSWKLSPLFRVLVEASHAPEEELYQVFNMGIGLTIIVAPEEVKIALEISKGKLIGKIIPGKREVILKHGS